MFNENYAKFLISVCKSLVLWSAVNASFFNAPIVASTANVESSCESYFKHVKQSLATLIPCLADEFVCAHIDLMQGMTLDAGQDYINFVDSAGGTTEVLHSINIDSSEVIELYSNMGQNKNSVESSDHESFEDVITTQNEKIHEINSAAAESLGHEAIEQMSATNCIACLNGNAPTGAHVCVNCSKFVHIFETCSKSCGDDEGYGQKRLCLSCSALTKKKEDIGPRGAK